MSQNQELKHKHSISVQIRFNDIDGLGHVNNAVYAQYFDMGRQGYFEKLNSGPMNWKEAGLVIASTHTDFLKPIFLKDDISVGTMITELGNKSIQMLQTIYDTKSGDIKASCKSVMVSFNPQTHSSIVLPDQWREKISKFEHL